MSYLVDLLREKETLNFLRLSVSHRLKHSSFSLNCVVEPVTHYSSDVPVLLERVQVEVGGPHEVILNPEVVVKHLQSNKNKTKIR